MSFLALSFKKDDNLPLLREKKRVFNEETNIIIFVFHAIVRPHVDTHSTVGLVKDYKI